MGLEVHFLEQQVRAGVGERRERTMHLQDGHHVAKLAIEAAQQGEDHLTVTDGVAELGEGRGHGLQRAAVVGDGHGVLAKVPELCLQE
jgi:hypothetical protein